MWVDVDATFSIQSPANVVANVMRSHIYKDMKRGTLFRRHDLIRAHDIHICNIACSESFKRCLGQLQFFQTQKLQVICHLKSLHEMSTKPASEYKTCSVELTGHPQAKLHPGSGKKLSSVSWSRNRIFKVHQKKEHIRNTSAKYELQQFRAKNGFKAMIRIRKTKQPVSSQQKSGTGVPQTRSKQHR